MKRTLLDTDPKKRLLRTMEQNIYQSYYLNLKETGIKDENISEVIEFIKKNPNITALDLSKNQIGPAGAILLASANLTQLKSLFIQDNSLGDTGAVAVRSMYWLDKLQIERVTLSKKGKAILANNPGKVAEAVREAGVTGVCAEIPSLKRLSLFVVKDKKLDTTKLSRALQSESYKTYI